MPESGIGKRLQHAHHCGGDAGACHKLHDAAAGPVFFTVETDDESSHDANAVAGDSIDGSIQRIAGVLNFA